MGDAGTLPHGVSSVGEDSECLLKERGIIGKLVFCCGGILRFKKISYFTVQSHA